MSTTPLDDPPGSPANSLDITYMVANGIGIVLFLLLASRGWRLPEDSDLPVTGEPMVWSIALPVLGVFFLADIVWGVLILRSGESKRRLRWLITGAAWLLTICLDFAHH